MWNLQVVSDGKDLLLIKGNSGIHFDQRKTEFIEEQKVVNVFQVN
jgi:hypothetical protein